MALSFKQLKKDMAEDGFAPFMRYDLCEWMKKKYGKLGCIAIWNIDKKDLFCSEDCEWNHRDRKLPLYSEPFSHCGWNW